jgi:CRP/FNR family transcriptional regulator, cyclic AMP receptor protein
MDRRSLLASIPLFESLSPEDLDHLGSQLEERALEEGEEIFDKGDPGDAMYLIDEGAIEISLGSGKQRVVLASLFQGQYFGELSLLDGAPRSASARAAKPTKLLALDRDDFVEFVRSKPDAALTIMSEIAERMRATNELMTQTVTRNVFMEEEEEMTFGERIADKVASFGGSWTFIFAFGGFMALWMSVNVIAASMAWDVYPFILLNLMLSSLAALQAPVIMMSQNRQSEKDKALAVNTYQVNLKQEIVIDKIMRGQTEVLQRVAMLERSLAPRVSGQTDAARPPS